MTALFSDSTPLARPDFIKARARHTPTYLETARLVKELGLHTVCQEAACPNIGDCWSQKHATVMILGIPEAPPPPPPPWQVDDGPLALLADSAASVRAGAVPCPTGSGPTELESAPANTHAVDDTTVSSTRAGSAAPRLPTPYLCSVPRRQRTAACCTCCCHSPTPHPCMSWGHTCRQAPTQAASHSAPSLRRPYPRRWGGRLTREGSAL